VYLCSTVFVYCLYKGERDLERNGCVFGYKDDESMVLISEVIECSINVPLLDRVHINVEFGL